MQPRTLQFLWPLRSHRWALSFLCEPFQCTHSCGADEPGSDVDELVPLQAFLFGGGMGRGVQKCIVRTSFCEAGRPSCGSQGRCKCVHARHECTCKPSSGHTEASRSIKVDPRDQPLGLACVEHAEFISCMHLTCMLSQVLGWSWAGNLKHVQNWLHIKEGQECPTCPTFSPNEHVSGPLDNV